jgi:hypothetical protein
VGEIFGAGFIREQDRNVIAGKILSLELIHDIDGLGLSFRDTDHR